MTSVPVIGVPINATLQGVDALLSIIQMPPGIPVATVGVNAAKKCSNTGNTNISSWRC